MFFGKFYILNVTVNQRLHTRYATRMGPRLRYCKTTISYGQRGARAHCHKQDRDKMHAHNHTKTTSQGLRCITDCKEIRYHTKTGCKQAVSLSNTNGDWPTSRALAVSSFRPRIAITSLPSRLRLAPPPVPRRTEVIPRYQWTVRQQSQGCCAGYVWWTDTGGVG